MKKLASMAFLCLLTSRAFASGQDSIGTFMHKGGIVMWPIALLGFVAFTIFVERLFYFYITGVDYKKFRDALLDSIRKNDISEIDLRMNKSGSQIQISPVKKIKRWIYSQRWNRSQYTSIASTYIENIRAGQRSREEALRRTGSELIELMEKHFKGLSSISQVAPLLGLLGTVTGIIGSFNVIAQLGGQVDVTALADGIWEAMLTTAFGLSVAIPAQLCYLYFEKIVSARANRMNYVISYLDEKLYSDEPCGEGSATMYEKTHAHAVISHSMPEEEII